MKSKEIYADPVHKTILLSDNEKYYHWKYITCYKRELVPGKSKIPRRGGGRGGSKTEGTILYSTDGAAWYIFRIQNRAFDSRRIHFKFSHLLHIISTS